MANLFRGRLYRVCTFCHGFFLTHLDQVGYVSVLNLFRFQSGWNILLDKIWILLLHEYFFKKFVLNLKLTFDSAKFFLTSLKTVTWIRIRIKRNLLDPGSGSRRLCGKQDLKSHFRYLLFLVFRRGLQNFFFLDSV